MIMKSVATKSSAKIRQTLVIDPSASVTLCWPSIMERLNNTDFTIQSSIITILRAAGIRITTPISVFQVSSKNNFKVDFPKFEKLYLTEL